LPNKLPSRQNSWVLSIRQNLFIRSSKEWRVPCCIHHSDLPYSDIQSVNHIQFPCFNHQMWRQIDMGQGSQDVPRVKVVPAATGDQLRKCPGSFSHKQKKLPGWLAIVTKSKFIYIFPWLHINIDVVSRTQTGWQRKRKRNILEK
jgi:hypothetical protein